MEQLEALRAFIGRRSGIEPGNYSDRASFMSDYRRILRDGRDARTLLRWLEVAEKVAVLLKEPVCLPEGVNRLTWDGKAWYFTACQYHAMEYRAAACRWLASAIVAHWDVPSGDGRWITIAANARNAFGPGIAKRWFQ